MKSAIRKLCRYGAEALQPRFVNDRWRGAAISARTAAKIRKQAVIEGTYGSFDTETGVGWDPNWDFLKGSNIPSGHFRQPKLHKRVRTREDRARKIETLMEAMPEKIEQYKEDFAKKRENEPGILSLIKRVTKKR